MVPAGRSRGRGRIRWAATVIAGIVGGLMLAAPTPAMAAPGLPRVEGSGPLSSADQDFVVKVKLAGLWEIPAGEMAAQRAANPRVREVGAQIAAEHRELDRLVEEAAKKVGIPLPTEPSVEQRFWLREMSEASGARFDTIFVDRLRAAHGKVFTLIASVRAGTRNDVVRQLAEDANRFVLNHMKLLESTGLVDYEGLPRPEGPAGTAQLAGDGTLLSAAVAEANTSGPLIANSVMWLVLAVALAAGGYTTYRLVRSR